MDITHTLPRGVYRLVSRSGADFGLLDARNPLDPRWNGEPLHRETWWRGDYLSFVRADKMAQRVQIHDTGEFAVAVDDPSKDHLGFRQIGTGTWTLVPQADPTPEPPPLKAPPAPRKRTR